MTTANTSPRILIPVIALAVLLCGHSSAAEPSKKLKVFILAGQSNMEGHARVETFDYIGDDPATAPLLKMMRGEDGKPTECEGAWISYLTGYYDGSANGEGLGKLTAGFGARGEKPTEDGGKIGPEFTFGLTMDAAFKEPVLIIKTAWGGRSLNTEFRPPSAGPYELNDFQKKLYYGPPGHGVPENMQAWLAEKKKETGRFYRMMLEAHVKKFEAELITPAEETMWKRGASNAGYHYLGCAKIFALMGRAFAEANLTMLKSHSND